NLQLVGWAFWLFGQALGQVAILLAPATVAACVTFSASLLSNALLAPLVLNERLTRLHGLGIMLLAVGGAVVTLASCHGNQEYSWHQLKSFISRSEFLSVAACLFGCALVLSAHAIRRNCLDLYSFACLFALGGSCDLLVTKFALQSLRLMVLGRDGQPLHPSWAVPASVALMLLLHLATFCCQ
ncbi:unnamed protein product, partial [Polarella glacialis]